MSDEELNNLKKLSKREREVLWLVCDGITYSEISKKLFISLPTVKSVMGRVYIKLNLDVLEKPERLKAIYQIYCPLLKGTELPEGSPPEADSPPPIPEKVVEMVDEDEHAIVPYSPWQIIHIPEENKKPPRKQRGCLWISLGLLIGLSIAALAYFAYVSFFLDTESDKNQELTKVVAQLTGIAEIPVQQVTIVVSSTPESELQTATQEVKEIVIVVTATPLPQTPTPTLSPTPAIQLPFEDNFDNGPRPEWQPIVGTWRMFDGAYYSDDVEDGRWNITLVGDENWTDYTVDVDAIRYHSGYPVRVIVRENDGSFMAFDTDCCVTKVTLVYKGEETVIARNDVGGIDGGLEWILYHIKVEVRGSIYKIYSNGKLLVEVQDVTLNRGRVGLALKYPIRYENFKVNELP